MIASKQSPPERKNLPTLRSVRDGIAFAKAINPKKEPLTIEKLKTFSGCKHYNEEEAAAIIRTIEQLTHIVFELMMAGSIHSEEQPASVFRLQPKQTVKTLNTNTKAA